jgi:hypothetical protein
MWRQRRLAKQIRDRELRKLLARPPEPPPVSAKKPEDIPDQQPAVFFNSGKAAVRLRRRPRVILLTGLRAGVGGCLS